MSVKSILKQDLIGAMKSGEKSVVTAIRMVNSKVQDEEKKLKRELEDSEVYKVIQKEIKDANETLEGFKQRLDEAGITKMSEAIEILVKYLPAQMGREQIQALVQKLISELGITSPKEKGKLMKPLMEQTKGQADGKVVNEIVTEELNKLQ